MNDKLDCHVVGDLLPQYADGLLSPESEEKVRLHLEECDECRKIYERMTAPDPQTDEDASEVDYLKKVKRGKVKAVIIAAAAVLLVAAACLIFVLTRPETASVHYDAGSKTMVVYGKGDSTDLKLPAEVNEAQYLDAQFDSFHVSVYLPFLRNGDSPLREYLPGYLDRTNKSLSFIREYLKENCEDRYPAERADKYVDIEVLPGGEYVWVEKDDRITLQMGDYYWHREELYVLSLLGSKTVQWKELGYAWYLGACVDPYGEALTTTDLGKLKDEPYYDAYFRAGGTEEFGPENERILNDAISYVCLTQGMNWGSAYESTPLKNTALYKAGPKTADEGDEMSVCMATSFIAYLSDRYGFDKVSEFCFGKLSFKAAFAPSFESVYDEWSAYVIEKCG